MHIIKQNLKNRHYKDRIVHVQYVCYSGLLHRMMRDVLHCIPETVCVRAWVCACVFASVCVCAACVCVCMCMRVCSLWRPSGGGRMEECSEENNINFKSCVSLHIQWKSISWFPADWLVQSTLLCLYHSALSMYWCCYPQVFWDHFHGETAL